MGREATCHCRWGNQTAQCKALLETSKLIVRAPIGRRASIASLHDIAVEGDNLHFSIGGDAVTLALGAAEAQRWAKKIAAPPPTLAAKLGISGDTHLMLIGECDSEELQAAIEQSAIVENKSPDLIIAMVRTASDLNHALDRYAALPVHPPIWIVYAKGPRKPINETAIRDTLRHEGFMDTKVASVSSRLTALRFIRRN
jgi:hypothetical protein